MQQRVQIPLNGIELAGVLFTPEHFDETKQYPAIMVVHPGGGYTDNAAPIDKLIKAVVNVLGYRHWLAVPRCLRRRTVCNDFGHLRASSTRKNRRSPRCRIDCSELCFAYIGRSGVRTICLRQ